jgi:hypothetical protein
MVKKQKSYASNAPIEVSINRNAHVMTWFFFLPDERKNVRSQLIRYIVG